MSQVQELRRIPIHRALNRPNLLAGGEREWMLLSGLITLILVVVAQGWLPSLIGVTVWLFAIYGLREMAKVDPQMTKVYLRHVRYQEYYPAHTSPFASGATHRRNK